jgi:hypothetical protein
MAMGVGAFIVAAVIIAVALFKKPKATTGDGGSGFVPIIRGVQP